MRHVQGDSRHQLTLLPEALDELIAPEHVVRVIDGFVDKLPLAVLGFARAVPKETGRKPYHPGDLLKLYLYGYLNQVGSSRRLERECQRNLELWWLLGRLAPDFKTIADFRRDNGPAIVASGRAFVAFCQQHGLLGQRVAVDGSKFHSAGSRDRSFNRAQLGDEQRRLEHYLGELETADAADAEAPVKAARVRAALTALATAAEVMATTGRNTTCVTDPDAQLMRSGRAGMIVGYNVQASVDEQSGVVVHHAVTQQAGDNQQLLPMAVASQAALGEDVPLTVLADAGYSNGAQLQACEAAGIVPVVPINRSCNSQGEYFTTADFRYDADTNSFRCPAGEVLPYKTYSSKDKMHLYHRENCGGCALKARCTRSRGRWVSRHFHEEAFARASQRLAADPLAMRRRMAIVEPVFGTLKRRLGGGRFRCWRLSGATAEMALQVLAHNLQRVLNLKGAPWFASALATA